MINIRKSIEPKVSLVEMISEKEIELAELYSQVMIKKQISSIKT